MRREYDLFSMYPLSQEKSAKRGMFKRLQIVTEAPEYSTFG
jgi:hypothetical protein